MEANSFYYSAKSGWSIPSFPDMDSENTLVILFCAPEFINNAAPIEQIATYYPHSKIIGCSSAGEIFGSSIFDHGISVAIIRFDKSKIKSINQKIESSADSYNAGHKIATNLFQPDLSGIIVLSEGLDINGSELLKGFNSALNDNKKIVITGGLAADGNAFKKTWVIYQGKILTNSVVAVGLYGVHVKIGHAASGGWDVFGPERHITRSKNNILYELDEQPALELYKKYLGVRAAELPASGLLYPLAIRKNLDDEKHLVRTILAINEAEQALIFAGDMPSGYLAQMIRGNFDRLIISASDAAETAIKSISPKNRKFIHPPVTIAISCVGRRLILGERTEEETELVLDTMPAGTQQIGYYSYGEISAYSDGSADLHNQTMALTILYED